MNSPMKSKTQVTIAAAMLALFASAVAAPAYAATDSVAPGSQVQSAQQLRSTVANRVENFAGVPQFTVTDHQAVDSNGNMYFAYGSSVQRITAGGASQSLYVEIPSLTFIGASSLTVSPNNTVYMLGNFIDSNGHTQVWWLSVTPNSTAFTEGQLLYTIDSTGATNQQTGLAYDPANGSLSFVNVRSDIVQSFVPGTDSNSSPTLTTIAGNGHVGFTGDGGPATEAALGNPGGLAYDSQGNLYIADTDNNRIRQVTPSGVITTIGGNGAATYSGDGGRGVDASINHPDSVAVDSAGNVYFTDTNNDRIRVLDNYRTVTTVIGSGYGDQLTAGTPAPYASLHRPSWVGVTGNGTLVFNSYPSSSASSMQAYWSGPLPQVDLTANPLPSYITNANTSGYLKRRDGGAGVLASFNINGLDLQPNATGTGYQSGPVTLVTQTAGGSPVTISAQSATYTVTDPIEFSNLLLLNNVTFTHVVDGVTYTSTIPNLSLAYESGYGLSYIATTPPNPMPWGDLVIPDLKASDGAIAPDNAQISGAWILQAGLTVKPVYSPLQKGL